MITPTCKAPIAFAVLLEYWLGELDAATEERIDEHLLGCGECSARLAELAGLGSGIRTAFRHGLVQAFVTDDFIRRLGEHGIHIREYRLPCNGSVNCTVTPEDELVTARLEAQLGGVTRLDAIFSTSTGGSAEEVLRDIPFNAASGAVVLATKMTQLRAMPSQQFRVRLMAVDQGGERVIGDYTFNHTAA